MTTTASTTPASTTPAGTTPAGSASQPGASQPPSLHLARLAEAAGERHPDHLALMFEGTTYGSAELAARARRAGAGFTALGVDAGDRVVVMLTNSPEVGVVYTALWRAGAVVTPVIFLLSPEELRHVLVDSGAVAVVASPELLLTVRLASAGLGLRAIVVVGGDGSTGAESDGQEPALTPYQSVESEAEGGIADRANDDLAALLYTGGTTGRSKGVMLSHANLHLCAKAAHESSHLPGITRNIVPLPLSHAYGLIVTVAGLHAPEPGFAVLQRWFDPVGLLTAIAQERLQRAALVPSMIQMLLAQPLESYDLSSLAFIGSGGAPLAPEVLVELESRVPGVTVMEGYGLTESGAVVSTQPPGARKVGTVGRPIPGYTLRLVDDAGTEVPAGEPGEVTVRGAGVMRGYWNAPEASAETLAGGWLHTGDIGVVDADGYLSIVDRKKDLIIRGGFNVFPRDVEDAMLTHPAVTSAAVVGRPDARVGEEVVAFVALSPGSTVTAEELVAHARTKVAANKYPREVRIVDAIPLTSVLKTDRKKLRAQLREEAAAGA